MNTLKSNIENIINAYFDSYLQKTWGEIKALKAVEIIKNTAKVHIQLGYPVAGVQREIVAALTEKLLKIAGIDQADINLSWQVESHTAQAGVQNIPGVKNIIAIASGKGGVGKSTTTVNLALALSLEGARVGILDADIYGPNQPQMLGDTALMQLAKGQRFPPRVLHGIQSMSMGYLIDPATPMIWRGPMVSSALQQLVGDTDWDNLDYLLIDLPPGTGDIQLTLSQKVPVNGAVIVTTPQDVALLDARKGLAMFRKVNVEVLGVVENMSTHICSQCGHAEAIFGSGGAETLSKEFAAELLGQLPLSMDIRVQADQGQPIVMAAPNGEIAKTYRDIARKVAAKLSLQNKSFAVKFPKIVTEKR